MASTDLTINRGTTYTITGIYQQDGTAQDITGATVRFTIKDAEYDATTDDSTAILSKNVTSFADPTAGQYIITIDPSDTQTVTPGKYYYSIKIDIASDGATVYELAEGRVTIDGDPTNRLS